MQVYEDLHSSIKEMQYVVLEKLKVSNPRAYLQFLGELKERVDIDGG